MKKSVELKVLRSSKIDEQQALLDTVSGEKRSMNADENSKFDALEAEITDLTAQIERQEKIEASIERNAKFVGSGGSSKRGEQKEQTDLIQRASVVDFIAIAKNERVEGASMELHQELQKNHRGSLEGIGLPIELLVAPEKRTASVVFDGNTAVPANQGAFIDAMRPFTSVLRAGAEMLTNLNGELILPRLAGGSAKWEGEVVNNTDKSGAGLDGVKLSPKRLTVATDYSKMLAKTVGAVQAEAIFRNDALLAIGEALDKAAINGSGPNQPTGVINMAGVNAVAIAAAGGAITYAKLLEMLQKQMEANGFREGMAFLTSPRTYTAMHAISKDSGSGKFLVDDGGTIQGQQSFASNFVPTDLTKSSGTALSALVLGWFPAMTIGQFGLLDVVVDPYSLKNSGKDEITINGYFDVKAKNEKFFTVCKDISS